MRNQPCDRFTFGREQPRRDLEIRDAEIQVRHHPSERPVVDDEAERGEVVDDPWPRVMKANVVVERHGLAEVEEQRSPVLPGLPNGGGQVLLGIVECLKELLLDSDHDDPGVEQKDERSARRDHGVTPSS